MQDGSEFIQSYCEQSFECSEIADAPVPVYFDPIVQDVLQGGDPLEDLFDETLASLPTDPGPTSGPFTGLTGGVPGGAGTEELVGFINGRGSDITEVINVVEGGGELTPEQSETVGDIATRGIDFDPILVGRDIQDGAIDDIGRLEQGNVWTDSSGVTWRYSPEGDSWFKIGDNGGSIPTTDLPPFVRGS